MTAARRLEKMQAAYDASGNPPGKVLFRWRSGYVLQIGTAYLWIGRRWREALQTIRRMK